MKNNTNWERPKSGTCEVVQALHDLFVCGKLRLAYIRETSFQHNSRRWPESLLPRKGRFIHGFLYLQLYTMLALCPTFC